MSIHHVLLAWYSIRIISPYDFGCAQSQETRQAGSNRFPVRGWQLVLLTSAGHQDFSSLFSCVGGFSLPIQLAQALVAKLEFSSQNPVPPYLGSDKLIWSNGLTKWIYNFLWNTVPVPKKTLTNYFRYFDPFSFTNKAPIILPPHSTYDWDS